MYFYWQQLALQHIRRLVWMMFGRAKAIEDQIIAWRREIHQNPELGLIT